MTRGRGVSETTQRGKILHVARMLRGPFSTNDLIVAVWKAYPEEFGMRAYDYPDTQKILAKIRGAKGLVRTGFLKEDQTTGKLSVSRQRPVREGQVRKAVTRISKALSELSEREIKEVIDRSGGFQAATTKHATAEVKEEEE